MILIAHTMTTVKSIPDGVQAVFLVAAPLAALALLVVLRLPELPLQTANHKS